MKTFTVCCMPARKRFSFLVVLFWMGSPICVAQTDSVHCRFNPSVEVCFQRGHILSTNPYLTASDDDPDRLLRSAALSVRLMKQTSGEHDWEQLYNYPRWGIGLNAATFVDNKELGTPVAFYGVFKGAIAKMGRFSLNYETGFGIQLNKKIMNPVLNEYNPTLSSRVTSFTDFGLSAGYELDRHFCLFVGYGLTHSSNGRLKAPNGGLNLIAPRLTIEYNVNGFRQPKIKKVIPAYVRNFSVDLSVYGGYKNVMCMNPAVDTLTMYRGVSYGVAGITASLHRQMSYKSRFGIGFSLGYDSNNCSTVSVQNGAFIVDEGSVVERINLSTFLSYELVIHRVSLLLQPGIYLIGKPNDNLRPRIYERLGLKYHLNEHLFAGMALRAFEFHHADFIEWSVGYRLAMSKKQSPIR